MRALALCLALLPGLAAAQAGHDIVVLGEVHDNPAHHIEQARIVAGLQPSAIVFEMLSPAQADSAAGMARDDIAALDRALGWTGSGWPDFAMYHPIFLAAPGAVIVGAALPPGDVRAAMGQGAAAVFGPGAADWGLTPLPPAAQAAREREMAVAHCDALPADLLPGMVEAQRLRDAHFARVAAAAFDAQGGPVVVITGSGHARTDRGIPVYLAAGRPDLTVWALGQVERTAGDATFDALIVTPAAPRPDPCAAAFGQNASRAIAPAAPRP